MYKQIFFFCLSTSFVLAKNEFYDGHALLEVTVNDIDQARFVNDIETQLNLDIWSDAVPGRPGMVLVSKTLRNQFQKALEAAGIEYKVNVENIKESIELEEKLLAAAAKNSSRASMFPFDTVHRYDVINDYMDDLAARYPNIVTVATAGRSFEGRDIRYLKISTTNFQNQRKPVVMMESLLHCREWVGLPATLYAVQKLVEGGESEMLNSIDWIVVPIANPDGYEFSHGSGINNRFWRKNRATGYMVANFCLGVDLNRNFDTFWGTASSNNVCSDTFHGSAPFSEPETQAIGNLIREHRNRMALYLDIHSFGSMILYGFGTGVLPPNGLFVHVNGVNMAQAIDDVKWSSNPNYIVGNVAAVLYQASGSSQDYAQAIGVPYSYTYELPAWRNQMNTLNGFLVDPEFIEQAGFETWEGIKAGARYAIRNFRSVNSQK